MKLEKRSVMTLPGVGKVKAGYLKKLNIETVKELLYHFPRGYQNRGNVCLLGEAAMQPVYTATILTVGSEPRTVKLRGGRTMTRFTAFDDSGRCVLTFFNQPYIKDIFYLGSVFRFWGKVEKSGRNFSMSCPEYEPYSESKPLPDFLPVYPLTEGIKQKGMMQTIAFALLEADQLDDPIPKNIRDNYHLPAIAEAMRAIHLPQNYRELDEARTRFIFEELYLFSLGMQLGTIKKQLSKAEILPKVSLAPFLAALPFEMTGAQKRAMEEIASDMTSKQPMSRLICGDVGSGKTVCAAGAIYIALKNQKQAALMVPTEILANQHYADLSAQFASLGFHTALLTGSLSTAEKRKVRAAIAAGKVDLAIGTHALLTEDTVFKDLGLVIADEQHRFGVRQRAALIEKGKTVHSLVMTATPIPRTLALILYSGLDISYIDELPPGRQKVSTYLVDEGYHARLTEFIKKQAKEGHQTYVVCPAVEEEDPENGTVLPFNFTPEKENKPLLTMKAAVQFSEELQNTLPNLNVTFLHGKMKAKEKDAIMSAFVAGDIHVLVSTTVIEVGVNVPNATLMIVENAERFGLSQLHQLRGRVGRGKTKSYCVLVSNCPEQSVAGERLRTLCNTQSGLEIANADLKQRGPGDFFPSTTGATRQSGEFSFHMATACTDPNLPQLCAMAAKETLDADPMLENTENAVSKTWMNALFHPQNNLIG